MARVINNTDKVTIACDIVTRFEDGTSSTKVVKVGDIVENLRYVKDKKIEVVTGRVTTITTSITSVTKVNPKNVVDYFGKDVIVKSIVIDASEQYQSKIVTVPAREIIEDEWVENVVKMDVYAHAIASMDIEYSDGKTSVQELEVGDVFVDVRAMTQPGQPDITGDFKLGAFVYKVVNTVVSVTGGYFIPLTGGDAKAIAFDKFITLEEKAHADVTDPKSLGVIANALNEAEDGIVYAQLDVDVEIPIREDGRITTLMIGQGKELNINLNNHNLDCQAYAFYVNGGTLNISGNGNIKSHIAGQAYPVIMVAAGGVCNMDGGVIDTTEVDTTGSYNWLYGVVCSGDGVFNMTGGKMIIGDAAGISITNGTATGEGAKFTIGGNAEIESVDCTAIYLADNKSVDICDDAKINGGIMLRMGNLTVRDNAVVDSHEAGFDVYPLGKLATESGCESHNGSILALTGVYGSSLGNDLNIVIKDNAKVNGFTGNGIDIGMVNTKYDQTVNVSIDKTSNISSTGNIWNIYTHDDLAAMAAEQGKTLAPETNATNLTVKIGGEVVYPVVDEG